MSGVPVSRTYNAVVPPSNYVAGVGRGAMGFTTVKGWMDGWMDRLLMAICFFIPILNAFNVGCSSINLIDHTFIILITPIHFLSPHHHPFIHSLHRDQISVPPVLPPLPLVSPPFLVLPSRRTCSSDKPPRDTSLVEEEVTPIDAWLAG